MVDITKLLNYLNSLFPEPRCALNHKNAYELLISTILSAQCTDKQVNVVTPNLFQKYPTPFDLGSANQEDVEKIIYSTGFYKNKAKNIIACAKDISEKFDGVVPNNMADLTTLGGVGRKTANVLLGTIHRVPSMVVDTHVLRISKRLGLTKNETAEKVELDLMKVIPKTNWIDFSHQLVLFGRSVCDAKKPKCNECELFKECEYAKSLS